MDAPTCSICGVKHWGMEHVWSGATRTSGDTTSNVLQAEIKRLQAALKAALGQIADLQAQLAAAGIALNAAIDAKALNLAAEADSPVSGTTLAPPSRKPATTVKTASKRGRKGKTAAQRMAAHRARKTP